MKLLVVEDDLEDEQLLCEALIEIEEERLWCTWEGASIVQVDRLGDALDCIQQDSFDAVILNLSLPDCPTLVDAFLQVKECLEASRSPIEAPVIALLDEPDENLANRLIREGAQDVLVKSELECPLLARSIRYGIERHRRSAAADATPWNDRLTGTLGRTGFLAVAERYVQLAIQEHTHPLYASVRIALAGPIAAREPRELLLLRAGELLRSAFGPTALIGRTGDGQFGIVTVGLAGTLVQALLGRAAAEIEQGAADIDVPAEARFEVIELRAIDDLESVSVAPRAAHSGRA